MSRISLKARQTRAAYLRDWRKKNRDKVRGYTAKYWERRAAKATETDRKEDDNDVNEENA